MKIKILRLTEAERGELKYGFRNGESHRFRMRCHAAWPELHAGRRTNGNDRPERQRLGKAVRGRRDQGGTYPSGTRAQAYICILFFACVLCGCSDYSEKLGGGYTFVHEGGEDNYIFHEYPAKGGEVPPNVISHDYDKYFIIAKQKLTRSHVGIDDKIEYPLEGDTTYYWLILKQEQKVFGPLDSINFQKLKKEYRVSDRLVLQ